MSVNLEIICNQAKRIERKESSASMEIARRNRFSAVGKEILEIIPKELKELVKGVVSVVR